GAARGGARGGNGAVVALGADSRLRPRAGPALARVGLGAGVDVVARSPVGRVRVRTEAGRRVAGAGDVTLIERGAGDGAPPRAGARLAGVRRGAQAAVVARRPVRLGRVRAVAGRRVAGAGDVALIGGRAGHRAPRRAGARLAGVLRAKVAVEIARRPIRLGRVAALTGLRITGPRVVALIGGRAGHAAPRRAGPRLAGVLRAKVAIEIARRPIRL